MKTMRLHPTALVRLRRGRATGASLFVLLLLLVAGERRLAEAHFNLRSSQAGLERADGLEGDEIRVRLIGLDDHEPPSLSDVGRVRASVVVPLHTSHPVVIPLGRPAPRGPPPAAPSAA
jgi:hypothetical protein